MSKLYTHCFRLVLAGLLFGSALLSGYAQTPVITSPASGATIATSGTVVQLAANATNNYTIIYLTDLLTNTIVYSSGYLYGTNPISQLLPPGLRINAPYWISAVSYNAAGVASISGLSVTTDNVATPSPYPVITAPVHGRPLGQSSVTVQLAGNPYNSFTVVEVIDLTTNIFLHQSPFLGSPNVISYTIPLTFDPTHIYRIQARNYSNIGGLYQTEITVNTSLPVARIYVPVVNATLTKTDYLFQADPVNTGTPPTQYQWTIEPTGSASPAQQPLTRYGQTIKLDDYLIAGRTYRTRVTGLMNQETTAPASGWNSFSLTAAATGPDTNTFQGKTDYLFRYLDKSQIPTQILYDRVFPLGRLDYFNQQGRQDTSSYNHFLQVHGELFQSNYNASNTMLSPEIVEVLAFQKSLNNAVPIGLLNYSFNVIDTNAVIHNLIAQSNGFFYDVPGRSHSPYLSRNVVVCAPLTNMVRVGTLSFSLPSELMMGNTTQTATSVQVRGGDANQTITLTPGGAAATLSYTQTGPKILRFIIAFSDGTTQTTYGLLKVYN